MYLSEITVEAFRQGVPITGALVGFSMATARRKKTWMTVLWALGGWAAAWTAQYLVLGLVERAGHKGLTNQVYVPGRGGQTFVPPPASTPVAQEPVQQAQTPEDVAQVVEQQTATAGLSGLSGPYEAQRKVEPGDAVQVRGTFTGGGAFGSAFGGE